jgi:hypothetical protein
VNAATKDLLGEIGQQLDRGIFPVVKNGGFVVPSESVVSLETLGREKYHERETQRRSATESRARANGRQGSSGESWVTRRPWTPGNTPSLLDSKKPTAYQDALRPVSEAYPGARMWNEGADFWLYTESSLLPGLERKACFLTGVSNTAGAVKSWAFWKSNAIGATWLGPRHTNFPDGSVCAYEPTDGTWVFGSPLIELLDIYSVWALRHLHYETFGRWPGPQSVPIPYERILEFSDDECCSCGRSDLRYGDCCKESDMKRKRIEDAIQFCIFSGWTLRKPPTSILTFMQNVGQPPRISEIL